MPRRRAPFAVVSLLLAGAALVPGAGSRGAPDAPAVKADDGVNALLAPIRDKHKLPGLIGALVKGDGVAAIGAVGVRKAGSREPVRVTDTVHLGSCTKPLTATRLAMLVEEKKLSWGSALGQVFPELKKAIHPDYQAVTLAQLLTHRAGLPENGPWHDLGAGAAPAAQRHALLRKVLKEAPDREPGTKFAYSNLGYVVAAAMAEKVTRTPWEDLMRQGLFRPLGMTSAGFGSPGTKGRVDQPWGHRIKDDKVEALQTDNPAVMSPAATVHCSVPDWAKFVALHMRGEQGKARLLKAETFKLLHTPPDKQVYAYGWYAVERPWAGGRALNHAGSNELWVSQVWAAPYRDFAILTATNEGGDEAVKACDEVTVALLGYYEKRFGKGP
jgi:CubicO group peptidase (beta-lactamase class C family)